MSIKKRTVNKLHELVWNECKRIIREKYKVNNYWICYTCGRTLTELKDVHTAHGKPKGALPLEFKYDIRNLKTCCYHCNVNLGGCSDIFISKLQQEKEGLEFLKEACYQQDGAWRIKRNDTLLQSRYFLEELLEKYKLL